MTKAYKIIKFLVGMNSKRVDFTENFSTRPCTDHYLIFYGL